MGVAKRDEGVRLQPPTWPADDIPKQIHLDLAVTDLQAAVAEAERLGARIAPVQPAPDRWRVLFDPAGHPFCLTLTLLFGTGMRVGEMLGLKWYDINFDELTISIERTLSFESILQPDGSQQHQAMLRVPKAASSRRMDRRE
jgi:hypothetical protein